MVVAWGPREPSHPPSKWRNRNWKPKPKPVPMKRVSMKVSKRPVGAMESGPIKIIVPQELWPKKRCVRLEGPRPPSCPPPPHLKKADLLDSPSMPLPQIDEHEYVDVVVEEDEEEEPVEVEVECLLEPHEEWVMTVQEQFKQFPHLPIPPPPLAMQKKEKAVPVPLMDKPVAGWRKKKLKEKLSSGRRGACRIGKGKGSGNHKDFAKEKALSGDKPDVAGGGDLTKERKSETERQGEKPDGGPDLAEEKQQKAETELHSHSAVAVAETEPEPEHYKKMEEKQKHHCHVVKPRFFIKKKIPYVVPPPPRPVHSVTAETAKPMAGKAGGRDLTKEQKLKAEAEAAEAEMERHTQSEKPDVAGGGDLSKEQKAEMACQTEKPDVAGGGDLTKEQKAEMACQTEKPDVAGGGDLTKEQKAEMACQNEKPDVAGGGDLTKEQKAEIELHSAVAVAETELHSDESEQNKKKEENHHCDIVVSPPVHCHQDQVTAETERANPKPRPSMSGRILQLKAAKAKSAAASAFASSKKMSWEI